mmetsp:Transcript_16952/g.26269  ORF Transcript_16952/g.26269 Transcript_16952/m.26269 type:complete len:271 (-) Transcript_16952:589-1401(-)
MSNYAKGFVSCEDSLPPIDGIFNYAATLTSVLMMVCPIHFLYRSINSRDKLGTEAMLYSIALTYLFSMNLYGHATGYIGPPCMDTCGCLMNLMLSTLVYREMWERRVNNNSKTGPKKHYVDSVLLKLKPTIFTMIISCISMFMYCAGFISIKLEETVTNIISPPAGIFVVYTMGRLSYEDYKGIDGSKQKKQNGRYSTWSLWKGAFVSTPLVVISVELEPSVCEPISIMSPFSRTEAFYHAVYLHAIIATLFWLVSECAFQLVRNKAKQV